MSLRWTIIDCAVLKQLAALETLEGLLTNSCSMILGPAKPARASGSAILISPSSARTQKHPHQGRSTEI